MLFFQRINDAFVSIGVNGSLLLQKNRMKKALHSCKASLFLNLFASSITHLFSHTLHGFQ
jgi:hypothetical protein